MVSKPLESSVRPKPIVPSSAERGSQCSRLTPGMLVTSLACPSRRSLFTTWTAASSRTTAQHSGVKLVKCRLTECETRRTAQYRQRRKCGQERTKQERDSQIHVIAGTTITYNSVASVWSTMRPHGLVAATRSVTRSYASTVSEITCRLHRHLLQRTRRP